MAIHYAVYVGDDAGGPIDYSDAFATTALLAFPLNPMAPGARRRAGVRAFDTITGLVEANTDAAVLIAVDAAGLDAGGRPSPVSAIVAYAVASGAIRVEWTWARVPGSADPAGFKVWATAGGSVNYAAAPNVTVGSFGAGPSSADVPGLTPGTSYSIGVRAYNAAGDDGNTLSASATADNAPPDAPDALAITTTWGD